MAMFAISLVIIVNIVFLLKIAPVDDADKEDIENSEYQVISYCSNNHDKNPFCLRRLLFIEVEI